MCQSDPVSTPQGYYTSELLTVMITGAGIWNILELYQHMMGKENAHNDI